MNQRQKALAEKAIKVRYNGLIVSLKAAALVAVEDNQELPTVSGGRHYREEVVNDPEPYPPHIRVLVLELERAIKTYEKKREAEDTSYNTAEAVMKKRHRAELETLYGNHTSVTRKLADTCDKVYQKAGKAVTAENSRREKKREDARKARNRILLNLGKARDDMILKVAFKGEGEEMMDLLDSLPSADLISRQLKGKTAIKGELTAPETFTDAPRSLIDGRDPE